MLEERSPDGANIHISLIQRPHGPRLAHSNGPEGSHLLESPKKLNKASTLDTPSRSGERVCFGARIVELCGQMVQWVDIGYSMRTFSMVRVPSPHGACAFLRYPQRLPHTDAGPAAACAAGPRPPRGVRRRPARLRGRRPYRRRPRFPPDRAGCVSSEFRGLLVLRTSSASARRAAARRRGGYSTWFV